MKEVDARFGVEARAPPAGGLCRGSAAHGGDREDHAAEHEHEADDADPDELGRDADDERAEADEHEDGAVDDVAIAERARAASAR